MPDRAFLWLNRAKIEVFHKIRATSRQAKERDTETDIFKYLNKPADKIL